MPAFETDTDRLAFLQALDNTSAVPTILGTVGGAIDVFFSSAYAGSEVGGIELESKNFLAIARASDVSGIKHNDKLTISGVDYVVIATEPDGLGMVLIGLRAPLP